MLQQEPDFATEKELEDAIAVVTQQVLEQAAANFVVLRGFGLDVAVFLKRDGHSACRFLEIKAFSEHHGRCGFGNQRGEGNQIHLLWDEVGQEPRRSESLNVFDPSIRWIIGNRSKPLGSSRFVIFTCEQAHAAAANGVKPRKQNNFRMSAFASNWITWPDLVRCITDFLVGPSATALRG
jgi:hypothetical protein